MPRHGPRQPAGAATHDAAAAGSDASLASSSAGVAAIAALAACDLSSLYQTSHSGPDGLPARRAAAVLRRVGPNALDRDKPLPWWRHLWQCYRNPFNLLLTVLAIVSWATEDLKATVVILTMVMLSVGLRYVQERRSGAAAARLRELVASTATVLRDGHPVELPFRRLVPGDVVLLSAGDMIPADGRLIAAHDFQVSQSAMTGESLPVGKVVDADAGPVDSPFDLRNLCFMGSTVAGGSARMLVLATGARTALGMIARRVGATPEAPTAFDIGISQVSWLLIRFMAVMVPVVFVVNGLSRHDWLEAALFALSVAVGLTPEMLPMIVTSTLAKGAVFLAGKKVVVKRLDAIQNFGAMDVLCTDKTGTLTQDRIALQCHIDVDGAASQAVLDYAYLNSHFQTGLKNMLDVAVLRDAGVTAERDPARLYAMTDELPFDFERRRMSVIVRARPDAAAQPAAAEAGGGQLLICKGALEEVLGQCTSVRRGETDVALQAGHADDIRRVAGGLNAQGMRVVAVAIRRFATEREPFTVADESDLTLVGYLAFLDPPKASTAPALRALAASGVTVKILTGDNEAVARHVCEDVGLAVGAVLHGHEVDTLDDAALAARAAETTLFVKLTPAQKERVVLALHAQGHVVGFMGDGINDAAALHAADIGISVDTAVDIAKEAADIILLEKSLMVLHAGVEEGRRTFVNMVKYVKLTASSNFGNVLSVLVASALLPFLPMLPLHLLVQNLLYDFAQAAVPFDDVDAESLARPQGWRPGEIGRFMLWFGPLSSALDLLTFGVLWFGFGANAPAAQAVFQSGWFVEGLLTQTLVVHLIRTRHLPFIESRAATPLLVTSATVMAIGIWLPMSVVAPYFKMVALPLPYFGAVAAILLSYAALVQVVKGVYARRYGWL